MTRRTPLRRTILQFSQIRLTELRTFMIPFFQSQCHGVPGNQGLLPQNDASSGEVIRRKLDGNLVSGQNSNKMHPHFSGNVS